MIFLKWKREAMKIDSSWNFKELVYNLKTLRRQYEEWLVFFLSCSSEQKVINGFIKYVRDKFYSLNLKEWQIDVCWEYMNRYKFYSDILKIVKRIDK